MTDIKQYEPLWGSWYVESMIGEGAFGKVYRVRKEEFGKNYLAAVKVISIPQNDTAMRQALSEGMDEVSARSYFHAFVVDIIQEVDMMSAFKGNSNVVSLEDHKVIEYSDEIGWDILIRMELLESLSERVTQAPLPGGEVIKLGIHICRALELCAAKHLIHRDIKPDNIFVSQYGDYKLGDFGIARQIERTVSGLSKKGTETYMAPEVYKGQEYGASVDTYSLGIVMYRYLNNNRPPFWPDFPTTVTHHDREEALRRRINGEAIPTLPGVEPELCAIVLKACAYDRADRFAGAAEMREALERVSGGVSYSPPEIPPRVQHVPEPMEFTESREPTEYVFARKAGSLPVNDGSGREEKDDAAAEAPRGLLNKLAAAAGISFGVLALLCLPGASLNSMWISFGLYAACAVQCALKFRYKFVNAAFAAFNVAYLLYGFLRAFHMFDYHLFAMTCGFIAVWAAGGGPRRGRVTAILGAAAAVISGILSAKAVYGIPGGEYQAYVAGSAAIPLLIAAVSLSGLAVAGNNGKRRIYGASALAAVQFFPMAALIALFASSAVRGLALSERASALFYMTSASVLRTPLGLSNWLWLSLLAQPLAFVPFFLLIFARLAQDIFPDVFRKNNLIRTALATAAGIALLSLAAWAISAIFPAG
jgi:serine/threonine protein kinase